MDYINYLNTYTRDYVNHDLLKTLLNDMENLYDGLFLKILVEPTYPTSHIVETYVTEFKLLEQTKLGMNYQKENILDDPVQMHNRIDYLHRSYENLMIEARSRFDLFQEQYKYSYYKVSMVSERIKRQSDLQPAMDTKSETSSSGYFSASESLSSKRKQSIDNEMDIVEVKPFQPFLYPDEYPKPLEPYFDIFIIGPNGTLVHRIAYESLQWKNCEETAKELFSIVFGDRALLPPRLRVNNRPKQQLDPEKMADIVNLLCNKFNVCPTLARMSIAVSVLDGVIKK